MASSLYRLMPTPEHSCESINGYWEQVISFAICHLAEASKTCSTQQNVLDLNRGFGFGHRQRPRGSQSRKAIFSGEILYLDVINFRPKISSSENIASSRLNAPEFPRMGSGESGFALSGIGQFRAQLEIVENLKCIFTITV